VIRPDTVLHEIDLTRWTPDEAAAHLAGTFDQAATQRPDLFEPYQIRLDGLGQRDQVAIMREALRETFAVRWPTRLARKTEG
jgi:hypothetical protein